MTNAPAAEVITFYSLNGGTGRSMAVSNIACLLASRCRRGEKVLVIDWSLEAPSLHHFFGPWPANEDAEPGLLDLFDAIADSAGSIEEARPDRFVTQTAVPGLGLVKAGAFDGNYVTRFSSFDWTDFTDRFPLAVMDLLTYWRKHFRYILIDSRGGVSDLSGMCAMMLPDRLVPLFTLSRPSIEGALEISRFAMEYRNGEAAPRPLTIFPVPARVELEEGVGRDLYQPAFESLFEELYAAPGCCLQRYFTGVQLPYTPRYARGEEIAVLEGSGNQTPLRRAYEVLAERLAASTLPWEDNAAEPADDFVEVDGQLMSVGEAGKVYAGQIEQLRAEADDSGAARALMSLGSIEDRAGQAEPARAHYLDAIGLFRQLNDALPLAAALDDLGQLERRENRWSVAMAHFEEAAELHRIAGSVSKRARSLQFLADLCAKAGDTEEARAWRAWRRCFPGPAGRWTHEHPTRKPSKQRGTPDTGWARPMRYVVSETLRDCSDALAMPGNAMKARSISTANSRIHWVRRTRCKASGISKSGWSTGTTRSVGSSKPRMSFALRKPILVWPTP